MPLSRTIQALVRGLAEAGRGTHVMVAGGLDIEDAVLKQLRRAVEPFLDEVP